VNFLYYDILHALQNAIDSCINSARDLRGYSAFVICVIKNYLLTYTCTYTAVRYYSITELAHFLDEDDDEDSCSQAHSCPKAHVIS